MFCSKCGTSNGETSKFCTKCGQPLGSSQPGSQNTAVLTREKPADDNKLLQFFKKRWMVITPVVVIIAVVLLFLNSIIMMIAPTYAVMKASENTISLLSKRMDRSPLSAMQILADCGRDGTIGTDFSYSDSYTDFSGSISLMSKLSAQNYGMAATLSVGGEDLDLTALFNRDRFAFNSSLIDDQYYGVTYDTFNQDIEAFADVAGIDDEIVTMLQSYVEHMRSSMDSDLPRMLEKYGKLTEQFVKDLKPVVSSEQVTIGGEKLGCKVVTYEITDDALDTLLEDFYALLSEDPEMREYLSSYLGAQNFALYGMYDYGYGDSDEADGDALYDDMMDELDDAISSFKKEYSGSLNISYFISGNKLVRFEIAGEPKISGEKVEFAAYADFGKNPDKNNIEVGFEGTDEYDDEIGLKITYQSEYASNVITENIKLKASSYGDSETVTLESAWDQKTGDITIALDTGYDDYEVDGNLKIAGGGLTLTLEDILLDEYDDGYLDLTLTASKGTQIPNPSYVNLDKWDEDFLNDLMDAGQDVSDAVYYGY